MDRTSEYIPKPNKSDLGNQPNSGRNTPVRNTNDSIHMASVSRTPKQ